MRYYYHVRRNPQFGGAVQRVLEQHGMTRRGQRERTGINHVTMGNMCEGYIPEMETVIRFVKGFDLNLDEWLTMAGYDPLPETGRERFWRRYRELCENYLEKGYEVPAPPRFAGGSGSLDAEQADEMIALLEEEIVRSGPAVKA